MANEVITCRCGKSASYPKVSVITSKEIQSATGFKTVCKCGGASEFLCPKCQAKAEKLARKLLDLVGPGNFDINQLIPR